MKCQNVPRSEWHKIRILKLHIKQNVTTGKDKGRGTHVKSKWQVLFFSSDSLERDSYTCEVESQPRSTDILLDII